MTATELSKPAHELQKGEPRCGSSSCCCLREERHRAEQVWALLEKQNEGNMGDCKHNGAPEPPVLWNNSETTDEISQLAAISSCSPRKTYPPAVWWWIKGDWGWPDVVDGRQPAPRIVSLWVFGESVQVLLKPWRQECWRWRSCVGVLPMLSPPWQPGAISASSGGNWGGTHTEVCRERDCVLSDLLGTGGLCTCVLG